MYKESLRGELSSVALAQLLVQANPGDKECEGDFAERNKKYKESKGILKLIFKEIEGDRDYLRELRGRIKMLPFLGQGSRNVEFLMEYPFL